MGRAEELFLRIKHHGAAEISRMISQQVVEELFLDYKGAATTAPFTRLDASDRKNLAKAISGFANSEGGVIIWGVDCRPSPPNGDVPTEARPISNTTAFKSLLQNAITGVTLPAHSQVENIALPISGGTDGFVVTHVPIGFHVPYRTLGDKEEYYIRAGSNFAPTPHSVLAGLFGRAPHPSLELLVRLFPIEGIPTPLSVCTMRLEVSVFNNGRGFAEDIFFMADRNYLTGCSVAYEFADGWTRRTSKIGVRDRLTALSAGFPPLPPGSQNVICTMKVDLMPSVSGDLIVDLTCGSRNAPATARNIVIPSDVLLSAVEHYVHHYPNGAEKKAGDALHQEAIQKHLEFKQ